MDQILAPEVASFIEGVGATDDPVLESLATTAEVAGVPTVGPVVGRFLRLFTTAVGAERVLELGSGTGYSAYWFAQAVGPDGTVILTEYDQERLEIARETFAETSYEPRLRYEGGDAIETVDRLAGDFDVVLIDNEKERYRDAFETVRGRLSAGGAIIADNAMTSGAVDFAHLHRLLEDSTVDGASEETAGIAAYLETVVADPAFETMVLPLGEGVAVSLRAE